MKHRIKNHGKSLLIAGFYLLCKTAVFAENNTKQMIHNVLAKYGISAGGRGICDIPKEPEYDVNSETVRYNREKLNGYKANN